MHSDDRARRQLRNDLRAMLELLERQVDDGYFLGDLYAAMERIKAGVEEISAGAPTPVPGVSVDLSVWPSMDLDPTKG